MNTEKCKYCGGSGKILMLFNYVDCTCNEIIYNWIEGSAIDSNYEFWYPRRIPVSDKISILTSLEKWYYELYLVLWMDICGETQKRYYSYLSEFSEEKKQFYSEKIINGKIKWLMEPLDTKNQKIPF